MAALRYAKPYTQAAKAAPLSNIVYTQQLSDADNNYLNQVILAAPTQRRVMKFNATDGSGSILSSSFSINPQSIKRTSKAVEAEFPTMASWHTYRWMVEPSIWEITGYSGFVGPNIIALISALDGIDNVYWEFPFIFTDSRPVKVISSIVQYAAPFSIYYSLILRELGTSVRNYQPATLDVSRIANSFVSPTFDPTTGGVGTAEYSITSETSLSEVVAAIVNKQLSKTSREAQMNYMITHNNLVGKSLSWSTTDGGPLDATGTRQTQLVYEVS